MFADAGFALDGGDLHVGRGHLSLHQQLAPSRADADDAGQLATRARRAMSGKAEGWDWKWLALCMGLNVPRLRGPRQTYRANSGFIGGEEKNMNRRGVDSLRFGCIADSGYVAVGRAG